jgi:tripeptide aminopeptidase
VVLPSGFAHTVTERFLRYAVIDTQSDPTSPTCPSTEKQKDLGRLLAGELQAMGLADAHLDAHGYVYATIPANTDKGSGHLLLLAYGHIARLHRQGCQTADRAELSRR